MASHARCLLSLASLVASTFASPVIVDDVGTAAPMAFISDGFCCSKNEIEASFAWALWKPEDGEQVEADYPSALYQTWHARAERICQAKADCRAVIVWKDGGYRLYTGCDSRTMQETSGIVRSFARQTLHETFETVADGRCFGRGHGSNELDSTDAWALLFPGEPQTKAGVNTETYATWVARAQERCMAQADCAAISVWDDAGYRLYKHCDTGSMEEAPSGRVRSFQWRGRCLAWGLVWEPVKMGWITINKPVMRCTEFATKPQPPLAPQPRVSCSGSILPLPGPPLPNAQAKETCSRFNTAQYYLDNHLCCKFSGRKGLKYNQDGCPIGCSCSAIADANATATANDDAGEAAGETSSVASIVAQNSGS